MTDRGVEKSMEKKKLDQEVYEYIVEQIKTGELLERQRITEQEMVENLRVSRTPVRKAFEELTQDGYLEDIENVGVHVKVKLVDTKGFQDRANFLEKLLNYYLFDIEKKEIIFDEEELELILQRMKEEVDQSEPLFERTSILYFEELLKYIRNEYMKEAILKSLRELFLTEARIAEILKNSRALIYKHLMNLTKDLAENNYSLARREIRILLNQMKLDVIEKS